MNKRNQNSIFYLAPVYRFVQNQILNTAPGISTQLSWQPVPGCQCHWLSTGLPVEIVDEYTVKSWNKFTVAQVPPGEFSPEQNTAILVMKNNPEVIAVMPLEDSNEQWEKIELAFIPMDYWENYGESYSTDKTAMYYPKDFTVVVEIKDSKQKVPATWILQTEE